MRYLTILFILFAFILANTQGVITRRGGGAAPAGVTIEDDFSSDPSSSWTVGTGTVNWDSGNEEVDLVGSGVYYNDTQLTGVSGYALVKVQTSVAYGGIYFRSDGNMSNKAYSVRPNTGTTFVWRYCTGASCTDIESSSALSDNGYNIWMGVEWAGTGASTTVDLWTWTSDPGDKSTWGASDYQFTNDPGANAADVGKYIGMYYGGSETWTSTYFYGSDPP